MAITRVDKTAKMHICTFHKILLRDQIKYGKMYWAPDSCKGDHKPDGERPLSRPWRI